MDNNAIHLPLDHESWAEYRALKAAVTAPAATYAMIRLFVNLGYMAQSGGELGVLDARGQLFLRQEMAETGQEELRTLKAFVACGFLATDNLEHLTPNPSLQSGEGNSFRCERFVKLNGHLAANYKPAYVKGHEISAHVRDGRRYEKEHMQFALLIPDEVWTKEPLAGAGQGDKMSHEEISQVMMLIRGCDNVLKKTDRPHDGRGFTPQLVANAFAVIQEFPDEGQRRAMLLKLLNCREHPAVPKTTEQLLARSGETSRFGQLAGMLRGKA